MTETSLTWTIYHAAEALMYLRNDPAYLGLIPKVENLDFVIWFFLLLKCVRPLLWQSKEAIKRILNQFRCCCWVKLTFYLRCENSPTFFRWPVLIESTFDRKLVYDCSSRDTWKLIGMFWSHFVCQSDKDWSLEEGGDQWYWHFPLYGQFIVVIFTVFILMNFEGWFEDQRPLDDHKCVNYLNH